MTKIIRMILTICLVFGLLTACSSEQEPLNPEAIEVSLSTDPVPAIAGHPLELKAEFTGGEFSKSTQVKFDIRVNGNPVLVDAKNIGKGVFIGAFTFPQSGRYDVYLHLYVDDLHMTKKKLVDVK